jgi:hypothetical protein
MKKLIVTTLVLYALLSPGHARSESGALSYMRCNGDVISVGDTRLDVLAKCGDPTAVEADLYGGGGLSWGYYAPHDAYRRGGRDIPLWAGGRTYKEVWTYNLGPDRLMESVVFLDGKVYEIVSHGYGY